jgi:hypothetical protein
MSYQLSLKIRKNRPLLLAGLILLQTTPAFAQIGQSDWVTPGAPDADTTAIGNSAPPSTGATFMNGLNPGTGWTPSQLTQPGARFEKKLGAPAATTTSGQTQQPIMAPVDMSGGGSQGWADASAQQPATQFQPQPQQSFQPQQSAPQPTQIGQSDWISPSGGGGSATPISSGKTSKASSTKPGQSDWVSPGGSGSIGQSALITPGGGSSYNTGFGTQSPDLGGYVSQNQQFNPGTGNGGMGMNQMGNQMGNMGGMGQMGNMGGMGQMGNMGGMGQMGNMGGMNQMGNMGGMGQMGGTNTTNMNMPYNPGSSGGMGGMGGMMGGMGGDAGSPMDALGKAIAGAAAMGLIPSSGDKNLQSGGGSYGGGGGGDLYRTKTKGNGIGNAINHVPGVRLTKDVHRSVNRAVKRNLDRNINYAINSGMRRAVRQAIWRY